MKSVFTYRQLHALKKYGRKHSVTPLIKGETPLSVTAHLDLDAFYSQVEQVRLELPDDAPLAVQQWQGLIAINYPARAFGITRHENVDEAKKKCPHLNLQHVPTWKEGDTEWHYHETPSVATHKVSLDPYRRQSRKIIEILRSKFDKVEKASVDESFIDLSKSIYEIVMQRYPELQMPPPYDDPLEKLPMPSGAATWLGTLIPLGEGENEEDVADWDDIALSIGAELVNEMRQKLRQELGFTCSAGIAHNKMLSKLGSAYKKPNNQTILRNRAVLDFMKTYKFTKIRNLGGKLGDQVCAVYDTDQVSDLLTHSLDDLKWKLGDETGIWVYNIIRGRDNSEVNARTTIKSMLSAKSFRPSINSFEVAERWLKVFAADIVSRMSELPDVNRPKAVTLHHRHGSSAKSKQAPIPAVKTLDITVISNIAKTLLRSIEGEGKAWPCHNLSLAVGGFEEKESGVQGIKAFFQQPMTVPLQGESSVMEPDEDLSGDVLEEIHDDLLPNFKKPRLSMKSIENGIEDKIIDKASTSTTCEKCGKSTEAGEEEEHDDFHMAMSLSDSINKSSTPSRPTQSTGFHKTSNGKHQKANGRLEKGQKRLNM